MRKRFCLGLLGMVCLCAQWTAGAEIPREVTLRGPGYEYVFETSHGLRLAGIRNRITGDRVTRSVTNPQIAAMEYGDRFYSLDMMEVHRVQRDGGGLEIVLGNETVECSLKIRQDKSAETIWQLGVKNLGAQSALIKVTFPLFAGLVMGDDSKNTVFFHGLNGGTFARSPVYVRGQSGYTFPVLDVYNKRTGGLYMVVRDTTQILKGFEAIKLEDGVTPPVIDNNRVTWLVPEVRANGIFTFREGCGMAVTYRQAQLASGQTYVTPEVAVGVHAGRWERAWESYARWLQSVDTMRPLPEWFRRILFSKPLFEDQFRPADRYEFGRYIRPFDGKYSMFVMGHWTDTRGDYNVRPKWGGPEPFRKSLAELRERGIRSSLYLEAVNVGPDARIAQEHSEDWTVIMSGETGRERDPESRKEWFMCPGSPWADYIARTVARVVGQTDCDVIYLDSVGLRYHQCESVSHGHAYRDGWHADVGNLLGKVVAEVDAVRKDVPIFSEHWSSDINAMRVGASHGIDIQDAMELTEKGYDCNLTGTNLFRFYFPQFKIIELEPGNITGVGMAMFNGNAIHHHFVDADLFRPMGEMVRVWGDNIDAFMSPTPRALVETGNEGVFMNRFPDREKSLYTVWNTGEQDPAVAAIDFTIRRGRHGVDVFNHEELRPDHGRIRLQAPASRLAAFAEMPRRLKVDRGKDGRIGVRRPHGLAQPSLAVFAKVRHEPATRVVFEDDFEGTGPLDRDKWAGSDPMRYRTGRGTAILGGGGTQWSNAESGAIWDYTRTRTLEISFRFLREPEASNYILASREFGTAPASPRFEVYVYRFLTMGYGTMGYGDGFCSADMRTLMRKPVDREFNRLKLVIDRDWRRAYVNDRFFVEVPLRATDDPSTPWQIGLQNIEVDYVRVYDGDASPGSPWFEQRAVQFPADGQPAVFDPARMFGSPDLTRLSVQLKDGERMVDEAVLK